MTITTYFFNEQVEVKRWDGVAPNGAKNPYMSDENPLYIDKKGTVYYENCDGWHIWCPAESLARHVHHLEQIAARK